MNLPAVETHATVKQIVRRTPDVKSIRVVPDDLFSYRAGQWGFFTTIGAPDLTKPLSISSSPTEAGHLEFTKKVTGSEFSKRIDALKPGDRVRIKYPFGNFSCDGSAPKVVFLSGGIGITPLRSIIRSVLDQNLPVDMTLLYGNNTASDIAFGDEFEAAEKAHPGFRVVHVLCKPGPGWQGCSGFISAALLREKVPDHAERLFYLCGPIPMVSALSKVLLEELKIGKAALITENFAGY